ncbi:calcium-binding protein [Nocardioides sp. MH1]|uniref:calcium-binding protein n=1 Tax=Nocardioides sp. MH1 TaxID=3242490 RepID=UPI00352220CD
MTSLWPRATARALLTLPVALGVTGLAASPAMAAGPVISNVGGVLTVTATSALDLYVTGSGSSVSVSNSGGDFAGATGSCTGSGSSYQCTGVTRMVVNGSSAADDVLAISSPVPMEVHGGSGDDELNTGDSDDVVYGDAGSDEIGPYGGDDIVDGGDGDDWQLRGDAGNDVVSGGAGNDDVQGNEDDDVVSGGPGDDDVSGDNGSHYNAATDGDDVLNGDAGDDNLYPGAGDDVLNGGADEDTADFAGYHGNGVSFRASLDGVANDGPVGEADNVGPLGDVEDVRTPDLSGIEDVTLVGDGGPNVLTVENASGVVEVSGLGGDDEIVTDYISGDDPAHVDGGTGDDEITDYASVDGTVLVGGDGNDTIDGRYGADLIDGGAGSDTITGGPDDDAIDGGPGTDSIKGEEGNDVIESADGSVDTVSCGLDADIAHVDAADVVAVDIVNLCESLTKVQPPKPDVTVPTSTKYRLNARGVATFSLTNNSAFAVTATATARTTKAIGSGTSTLASNASGKLGIKLSKAALSTIKKKGKLKASVTFVLKGNGQSTQVKRSVTFLKH